MSEIITKANAIYQAYLEAERRRPYKLNQEIINAAMPGGGEWRAMANHGAVTRSIMWGAVEVALVNPQGRIDDHTEGQIAMGMRATPLMDAALRSIIVLAEAPENLPLIRELAISAIAYVEQPAPRIEEPEPEEPEVEVEDDEGESAEELAARLAYDHDDDINF